LLDELQNDWPGQWQDVAHQNNLQAPMWLRINRQKTDRETFVRLLADAGLETRLHDRAADAVALHPPLAVGRIPGFANGLFSVQDPAAQLAADLVAPQAGERILDACAAPGGKTCHLLEREPGIRLLALDRDGQRLKLVRENLDRLELNCELQIADAAQPESWWDGKPFDRILLDAPCSTTGVIRRHPEIKWLRDPQQVGRAVELQRQLLDQLWPLLKRGGILVYATCSVLRCENHKQIHGFLSRHEPSAPAGEAIDRQHERQILPGEEQMDGFYYAVLHKPA
jgi:16S rRNA (cytosine967-C5)-methyltransferase